MTQISEKLPYIINILHQFQKTFFILNFFVKNMLKRAIACDSPKYQVQLTGLEPEPTYVDMNLNHARMPIPPQLLALLKHNRELYNSLLYMQSAGLEPAPKQYGLDP